MERPEKASGGAAQVALASFKPAQRNVRPGTGPVPGAVATVVYAIFISLVYMGAGQSRRGALTT